MCEILNELDGNVSVEAGVRLQIGLKRMFSVAKDVVKVFINCNVAAVDQPKEEEMIIIYNIIDDQNLPYFRHRQNKKRVTFFTFFFAHSIVAVYIDN